MRAASMVRAFAPALAVGAAVLAAACADGSSPTAPVGAPVASSRALPAAMALPTGLHLSVASLPDTARGAFVITPGLPTTVVIGGAVRIRLDRNATCDPARAAYGPAAWDLPCERAAQPITVAVKAWRDAAGQPRLQFSPDLRFAPGTTNAVWVATKALGITADYRLDWCPSGGGACVNEALNDPAMLSYYDGASGILVRRVKHFSGYTVVAN